MRTERNIHNGDPKDQLSYVETHDENGNCTSMIWGKNPKDPWSYVATYDDDGDCTSCIYGENPKDPDSFDNREVKS